MSSTPLPPPEPYERATAYPEARRPVPAPQSRTVGLIAFLAALAGVVVGSILAVIAGVQAGGLQQYAGFDGQADPTTFPPDASQKAIAASVLGIAAFAVYGVFALWGFIQGIVAAVRNRGRGWGFAAVAIAVLGGIVVIVAFVGGIGIGVGSGV
ncbi:hypothetical protein SAMN04487848_3111 [Microbacterium sp. ru370.1]|uniref:hypothetical protein n=1 Tax=unclassified Microbacterium TaxID=2609290 RepID=UPI000890BFDA|nr:MULTISPECIES: hypothetical protein [unclassified Microbacterium]SDP03684.1 hypothetical protein SAMN04487848_3111 [Microbacterium sp. ru370.1]SIT91597.1 hypothetical protein SAMN05880579_2468 [Microbacterium sp. RU1D]